MYKGTAYYINKLINKIKDGQDFKGLEDDIIKKCREQIPKLKVQVVLDLNVFLANNCNSVAIIETQGSVQLCLPVGKKSFLIPFAYVNLYLNQ